MWVRRFEEVKFTKTNLWPFPVLSPSRYYFRSRGDLWVKTHIIGFCGKIYPVVEVSKDIPNITSEPSYCYSLEEVNSFIESNYREKHVAAYYAKKWDRKVSRNGIGESETSVKRFFDECTDKQSDFVKFFLDSKTPVFTAHYEAGINDYGWRSNLGRIVYHGRENREEGDYRVVNSSDKDVPTLKDLKFFRIFETQIAFQNIHQYISGVLGFNNPYVPEMDNITKRDSHGFDNMSFKKEPTKKKR